MGTASHLSAKTLMNRTDKELYYLGNNRENTMSPAPKCCPQEQEITILNAAAECIESSSLMDFTMSAIAKGAGISIGSLYKHVQSKEDVLIALATQMYSHNQTGFETLFKLPLTTPEKLAGLCLVDHYKIERFSFSAQLDSLISCDAILQRASVGWIEKMKRGVQNCKAIFDQLLLDASKNGELLLETGDRQLEELNIGCWSMHAGYNQTVLRMSSFLSDEQALPLPYPLPQDDLLVLNLTRLINSFPWEKNLDPQGIERCCKILEGSGLR